MKLLYLDSMDLANLGDHKWGTALDDVARTLNDNDAILTLSWHHFYEAVGVGVDRARERFLSILDAGISPQLFAEDPAIVELRYFKSLIEHSGQDMSQSIPLAFHPLTSDVLDGWLSDAAATRPELRGMHELGTRAEFFQARSGSGAYQMPVGELLVAVDEMTAQVDVAALIAKAQSVDLAGTFDDATQRRFTKKMGEGIADVLATYAPGIEAQLASVADVPNTLRALFSEYGIDADGADRGMALGTAFELVMIRKRGIDHFEWQVPRFLLEFLVANRISFVLDEARRLDTQRISEPGDFTDTGHAAFLPFVSVMTADRRTVAALRSCQQERIALHAAHLFPGGNQPNLYAALAALATAPDQAVPSDEAQV